MSKCLFYGLSFLGPVLFTGCVTAPKNQSEQLQVSIPQAWSVPSSGAQLTEVNWLNDFASEDLAQWVEWGLSNNYDLKATATRLEIAGADALIAGADLSPQLRASLQSSRQKISLGSRGFDGLGASIFDNNDLAFNINWELDVWGRLRDRKSAALADVQVASATVYGAQLSLAATIAKTGFGAIEAKMQRQLAEEIVKSYQSTESIIAQRFDRGMSSALDLRLIRGQLAAAQASLNARAQNVDAIKRNFMVLVGSYPSGDFEFPDALPESARLIPAGLPSALLQRRPDLVIAERNLAASMKRVDEAKKTLLPAISLTGSYGTTSDDLSDLLDRSFSVWSLVGNLAQPIFQGGRLKAGVQRSEAVVQQRLADYAQAALTAFNEVEQALAAEIYLEQQKNYLRIAAEETQAAEILASKRYQKGLTDIITVLDSQRRSFESRSSYITVKLNRLINRIDLYLALGGDFGFSPKTK